MKAKRERKLPNDYMYLSIWLSTDLPSSFSISRGCCAAPGSPRSSVRTSGASLGSVEKSHDQLGQLLSPRHRRKGGQTLCTALSQNIHAALKDPPQVCRARQSELGSLRECGMGTAGGSGDTGQLRGMRLCPAPPSHPRRPELSPEPCPAPGRCSGGGGAGMGWRSSALLRLLPGFSSLECHPVILPGC